MTTPGDDKEPPTPPREPPDGIGKRADRSGPFREERHDQARKAPAHKDLERQVPHQKPPEEK